MDEFDVYSSEAPLNNAEVPKTNGTLAFVYGLEQGNFADIAQQTATFGPAHVAREKAKLARADNLQLIKEATVDLAKQGNTPAVTNALNQIKQLEVSTQTSFHDDVAVSSEAATAATVPSATRLKVVFVDIFFLSVVDLETFPRSACSEANC
jgi:hypothetical protein